MPHDVMAIALSRIDMADITYRISTDRDDRLTESIRRIGLLHPVRLLDRGAALTVISGFRRITACLALPLTRIDARVVAEADLGERQRCLLSIGDNITQRPLNPVETARAVKLLHDRIDDPEVLRESLNDLTLPENPHWIEMQLALAVLPPGIQDLLLKDVIGTAMALELGRMAPDDGNALGRVFAALHLSLSRQREVLAMCRDLSRRDGLPIREVLEGSAARALLNDPDTDTALKTHGLRRLLKKLRYPALVAAEADFNDCLKSLALGQGIRLEPPPFFESNAYKMTLTVTSVAELRSQLAELNRKASSPHLARILDRSDR